MERGIPKGNPIVYHAETIILLTPCSCIHRHNRNYVIKCYYIKKGYHYTDLTVVLCFLGSGSNLILPTARPHTKCNFSWRQNRPVITFLFHEGLSEIRPFRLITLPFSFSLSFFKIVYFCFRSMRFFTALKQHSVM